MGIVLWVPEPNRSTIVKVKSREMKEAIFNLRKASLEMWIRFPLNFTNDFIFQVLPKKHLPNPIFIH